MTVGIAAICRETADPTVVFAADRMITTGQNPQIEYEHTKSKIQTVHDDDVVSCMGVASGTVSFIEDFFHRLNEKLEDSEPVGVRNVATNARKAYKELAQDTVQHQVLDQFGISLDDLSENQSQFDSNVLSSLLSDVSDAQNKFASQLEVLIGGVDGFGAHIYSIQNFDISPQNNIGYHAVGSGTQPARSVFIRNEYNTECSIEEGLLNIIEAKSRSEEARGVGRSLDVAVAHQPAADTECCTIFDENKKEEWANLYDDIVDAELNARKETIMDSGLEYTYGDQQ